ncbi:hypothetical protein QOT17_000350 [Balamuthia mandrillaris]
MALQSQLDKARRTELHLQQELQALLHQDHEHEQFGVPRTALKMLGVTVVDQEAPPAREAKRPFAIYKMQVSITFNGLQCTGIFGDRYSNLRRAHHQLTLREAKLPSFPSKHWPNNMTLPHNTKLRAKELLDYYSSLFQIVEVLQNSSFLLRTLGLPEEVAEAAAAVAAFAKEKKARKQSLAVVNAKLKEVKQERAHLEEFYLSQTFHYNSGELLRYSYHTKFNMSEDLWDYGCGVIKGRGDNVWFEMDLLNPSLFKGDLQFAIVNRQNKPLVLINEDANFERRFIIERVLYQDDAKGKKQTMKKVPICTISRTSVLYLVEYFGSGGNVSERAITIHPGYQEQGFQMVQEGKLACQMEREWYSGGLDIHMHAGADVLLYLALCFCVYKMRRRHHGRPRRRQVTVLDLLVS